MKYHLFLALALSACAMDLDTSDTQQSSELNFKHKLPANGFARPGGGGASNLSYHGGPTITNAHIVTIFWGNEWTTTGATLAQSINGFVAAYGTSGEYNTITQYSGIQKSSLAAGTWTDTANQVPHNATDADIQAEASRYIAAHGFDPNAIYEVFLPSTSYSSDGTSTSCGGTNLAYCAYHGNFVSGGVGDVRYASMPYPSCGGCQSSGFNIAQNFEHFISHETREAVTDADGTAWYDRRGNEADDKCAWSPAPFTDGAVGTNTDGSPFAFQYEWSNASSSCVQTR